MITLTNCRWMSASLHLSSIKTSVPERSDPETDPGKGHTVVTGCQFGQPVELQIVLFCSGNVPAKEI